jgi:hypothetical protein
MGPCVCIGGGGNCDPLSAGTTTKQFLAAFGFLYDPNDPLSSIYPSIITSNTPQTLQRGKFATGYAQFAEACLRARTLLYCNKVPGDGTTPTALTGSLAGIRATAGLGITSAGLGISVASKLGTISSGLSSALGLATAGAGIAVGVILQIFQNHAAAVQAQANALTTLCPEASVAIQQIDLAVANGQASPTQGMQALQQLQQIFVANTRQLTKDCNAFCAYIGILGAQIDLSPYKWGVNMVPNFPVSTARAVTPLGAGVLGSQNGIITPTAVISSPHEELATPYTAPPATASQSLALASAAAPLSTSVQASGFSPLVIILLIAVAAFVFLK